MICFSQLNVAIATENNIQDMTITLVISGAFGPQVTNKMRIVIFAVFQQTHCQEQYFAEQRFLLVFQQPHFQEQYSPEQHFREDQQLAKEEFYSHQHFFKQLTEEALPGYILKQSV